MICLDESNQPFFLEKKPSNLYPLGCVTVEDGNLLISSVIDKDTMFDSYIDFQSLPHPLNTYVLPCPSFFEWENESKSITLKEWESILMNLRSTSFHHQQSMTLLPSVCNHTTEEMEEEEEEEDEEENDDVYEEENDEEEEEEDDEDEKDDDLIKSLQQR
jgi:hypothetical protein